MSEPTCKSCQRFYQHYGVRSGKFYPLFCGHCACGRGRTKTRRPDQSVCEYYIPGTDPLEDFATKEYLTKALLDYTLSLELLPDATRASDLTKTGG